MRQETSSNNRLPSNIWEASDLFRMEIPNQGSMPTGNHQKSVSLWWAVTEPSGVQSFNVGSVLIAEYFRNEIAFVNVADIYRSSPQLASRPELEGS